VERPGDIVQMDCFCIGRLSGTKGTSSAPTRGPSCVPPPRPRPPHASALAHSAGLCYLATILALRPRASVLAKASAPIEVTVDAAELDHRLATQSELA
jgi:hypothetical protein